MTDIFEDFTPGLDSPPTRAQAITPSDTEDLAIFTRAINVAQGGVIHVTTLAGDDVTLSIAAGVAFPVRVRRVWATGTTASGVVGLA